MDRTRLLILTVAMGLVLDVGGVLHLYGYAVSGPSYQLTFEGLEIHAVRLAASLLVLAGFWLAFRHAPSGAERGGAPLWMTIPLLLAALLSIADIVNSVSPSWSPAQLIVLGGSVAALVALVQWRAPAAATTFVALALGVMLRLVDMQYSPLEPSRGDMLPLVLQALDTFFQGHSPYTTYFMPWELPLTYLPLTWLAYAPAFLLGLDIRWTNIIAEIAVLGAALFVARHTTGARRRAATDVTLLLWAWFFLLPTIRHWDMVTSAPIGWVAIAWTLALVVTGRHRLAPLALGLAAGTTPLIVVFGPLIALCWWREGGLRAALSKGALAAIVAAIVLLPWFIWAPSPFLEGNVQWFNNLDRFPRMKWETERTWTQITGFSGFFWERGREQWLKPIQLAAVALVAAIYAARGASRADLPRHAVGAFLLFMLFNPVLWPYLYDPALIAALLAVAGAGLAQPAPAVPLGASQDHAAGVVLPPQPASDPAERGPLRGAPAGPPLRGVPEGPALGQGRAAPGGGRRARRR